MLQLCITLQDSSQLFTSSHQSCSWSQRSVDVVDYDSSTDVSPSFLQLIPSQSIQCLRTRKTPVPRKGSNNTTDITSVFMCVEMQQNLKLHGVTMTWLRNSKMAGERIMKELAGKRRILSKISFFIQLIIFMTFNKLLFFGFRFLNLEERKEFF